MAPVNGVLVLFGGDDGNGDLLSDTWTWDGGSWTQIMGAGPPPRTEAVMASM
jgi:hypothetical protein